jgi:gamma-glutamyltranspeptidase/glutathione hydrolase
MNIRKAGQAWLLCAGVALLSWSVCWAAPGKHAIASAHPLATAAGFEILDAGGNAFDAAVAVAATLAVVEPYNSGLGGGGFFLLHRARDGFEIMLDARETAPGGASAVMYLDAEDGEIIPNKSKQGPLAAGIPGMPAALQHLAKRYGNLPLQQSLQPAIRHAGEGFIVDGRYRAQVQAHLELLQQYPATAAVFLQDGKIPAADFRLVQADLAQTLAKIAAQGAAGFYAGEVAKRLLAAVQRDGNRTI